MRPLQVKAIVRLQFPEAQRGITRQERSAGIHKIMFEICKILLVLLLLTIMLPDTVL